MIVFLRGFFIGVVVSMLAVTSWAGSQCPLFAIPREVYAHPWFIATLADAYWGFATFFVWVCFKENSPLARVAWFLAIMLLGNIAMAAYGLNEAFRTPRDGRVEDILLTRRDGVGALGLILAAIGMALIAAALA